MQMEASSRREFIKNQFLRVCRYWRLHLYRMRHYLKEKGNSFYRGRLAILN